MAADERWQPVLGYEAAYEVSDAGRVRSLSRTCTGRHWRSWQDIQRPVKARLLKLLISSAGYAQVCLSLNGDVQRVFVHRLVAAAFIPNPDCLPMVNHIDGKKMHNKKSNLEWVTAARNMAHAYETGLNTKTTLAISEPVAVAAFDSLTSALGRAPLIGELATHLGVSLKTAATYRDRYGLAIARRASPSPAFREGAGRNLKQE